ncbi:molybdate ABC transporter substrate-binding protein [Pacificimonas flava]|uniref:Molybdate ABC transporter substrate-binding protein n=2 Tax=Pacificimonas TaxID=1960290 RepID=A0A219B760_9SPHN|nr:MULTISPECIES: molybdate ABC transporter substrate-binding protein [Pacificimonas]MBZ6379157.1 molybdate ABC transporter substrate-binding protein [Pacificimonas aurantium]OWV33618.1 molybdate ABC transporter substrate-binding protein [Pacificimonas flava]
MKSAVSCLLFLLSFLALCDPAAAKGPLVLVAASMTDAAEAAADEYVRTTRHERPVISAAATSALARQVASGARADLFISADEAWMDWLVQRDLVHPRSRTDIARNRLVLVSAKQREWIDSRAGLLQALGKGRLAVAEPESVPAGRYAHAALSRLGAWGAVANRLAPVENVRAALALVERGAAPLGVVYQTDARATSHVAVVGRFAETAHPPIVYPAAILIASTHPETTAFLDFLTSNAGRGTLAKFGFGPAVTG